MLLFLCTGNSARSQIAEALAVAQSGGLVEAYSAGSRPKPLHANTVRVMAERGIDLTSRRSKHLSLFTGQRFDYVITLCDRVPRGLPGISRSPRLHPLEHPGPVPAAGDDDAATLAAFRRTAAEVETRIAYLLARIAASPGQAIV